MKKTALTWREGSFSTACLSGEIPVGGWIAHPFGIHRNMNGHLVLTHLPTGLAVPRTSTETTAINKSRAALQRFAEALIAVGLVDWSGPRRARLGQIPSLRGKWFRNANRAWNAARKKVLSAKPSDRRRSIEKKTRKAQRRRG